MIAESSSQTQIPSHSKGSGRLAFNAAIDDLDLDPVEFRAYCHILRRGECWESVARQAAHCKVSESTYRRALKRLVYDHKIVIFTERPGLTTIYRALPPTDTKHVVQMPLTPSENDSPPLVNLTPTPSRFDRGGVSNLPGEPLSDLTPKVVPIEVNTHEGEEGKEEQTPEPFRPPSGKAFQAIAQIVKSEVGFLRKRNFDFDGAIGRWGDQLPDIWEFCFRAQNRKPDDTPIRRFQDACERKFETGHLPLRAPQAEILAPAAPAHTFERFEEVMTPSGVHTLLDVMPNGLVVFENSPNVWKVHQIQHLDAPGAEA